MANIIMEKIMILISSLILLSLVIEVSADCNYDGQVFKAGDSFQATDGCNTCSCGSVDRVICTLKECKDSPRVMCRSGGRSYEPGAGFTAEDGCNTCTCSKDGEAACSKKACPPGCFYNEVFYQEGDSFKDRCNQCVCGPNHRAECTKMDCFREEDSGKRAEEKPACFYDNKAYFGGEVFQEKGDCNQCKCTEQGQVSCTERWCAEKDPPMPQECHLAKEVYKIGEQFKSESGCECYCGPGGALVCNLTRCEDHSEFYDSSTDNAARSLRVSLASISLYILGHLVF